MALNKVVDLRRKIYNGMRGKFVLPANLRSLQFKSAEKTYLREIKRLKRKINAKIVAYNQTIDETNLIIKSISELIYKDAQPGHPEHTKANGTLSKDGIKCIGKLYAAGATPLAVSYLMKISLVCAKRWYKRTNS